MRLRGLRQRPLFIPEAAPWSPSPWGVSCGTAEKRTNKERVSVAGTPLAQGRRGSGHQARDRGLPGPDGGVSSRSGGAAQPSRGGYSASLSPFGVFSTDGWSSLCQEQGPSREQLVAQELEYTVTHVQAWPCPPYQHHPLRPLHPRWAQCEEIRRSTEGKWDPNILLVWLRGRWLGSEVIAGRGSHEPTASLHQDTGATSGPGAQFLPVAVPPPQACGRLKARAQHSQVWRRRGGRASDV